MARDAQIAPLACGENRERRVDGSAYHCPVLAWDPAILGSTAHFAIGWIISPTVEVHFKSDWRAAHPAWPGY
ncbi:hypothetical protein ASPCADRAFT_210586 [Aspergillus carbonarius ITEM 5010]|uniref:Uncharacterized protein n=1 Tax=Aspergillus carbonarius (strain ITEM 5010) TaxID=602072 RepID=A0A1R3RCG9_ASPC5|nr:hypothetical protein ASPCADRAFT_210586 [Aspergillus carbonarius ITEM 5010]